MKKQTLKFENDSLLDCLVAVSIKERENGLRNIQLEKNQAMLFIWPEPTEVMFWNLGVNHDVALCFLDGNLSISSISIMKANSANVVCGPEKCKYVLEMKPETLQNLSIGRKYRVIDVIE